MATEIDTGSRVFLIGNVFSRAFGVMGGAAAAVFGISFLLGALPQAVWGLVTPTLLAGIGPGNSAAIITLGMLGALVALGLNALVQAALVQVVIAYGEGRTVSISDGISRGLRMILPILGLVILCWLAIMIGFVLLVVPGIILAVWWCVSGPALVDERAGIIASMGRSRHLTKGARWKVFGLLLLLVVLMYIVLAIVGVIAFATGMVGALATAGSSPSIMFTVISLIFNTVLTAFWATLLTSLFVELRNWKDGLDPGNLQEVFA